MRGPIRVRIDVRFGTPQDTRFIDRARRQIPRSRLASFESRRYLDGFQKRDCRRTLRDRLLLQTCPPTTTTVENSVGF